MRALSKKYEFVSAQSYRFPVSFAIFLFSWYHFSGSAEILNHYLMVGIMKHWNAKYVLWFCFRKRERLPFIIRLHLPTNLSGLLYVLLHVTRWIFVHYARSYLLFTTPNRVSFTVRPVGSWSPRLLLLKCLRNNGDNFSNHFVTQSRFLLFSFLEPTKCKKSPVNSTLYTNTSHTICQSSQISKTAIRRFSHELHT